MPLAASANCERTTSQHRCAYRCCMADPILHVLPHRSMQVQVLDQRVFQPSIRTARKKTPTLMPLSCACSDLAGWGIKGRLAPELAGLDHLQSL